MMNLVRFSCLDIYECNMHTILRNERMKIILNIEDDLISDASEMTGIKEKTALVRLGLQTLISRESAKRLAILGRSEKNL